jgi:hypothetical protein
VPLRALFPVVSVPSRQHVSSAVLQTSDWQVAFEVAQKAPTQELPSFAMVFARATREKSVNPTTTASLVSLIEYLLELIEK